MPEENEPLEQDSEGVKSLRKQHEAQQKRIAELENEKAVRDARDRASSVATILEAKGIAPSAASFYSGEDVSEDAVGKWLEAHADVFNVTAATSTEEDANTIAAARVNAASSGRVEDISTPTGRVHDPEEALRLFDVLPYEELLKRGLVADPEKIWGVKR